MSTGPATPAGGIPKEFRSKVVIFQLALLAVLLVVAVGTWRANRVEKVLDYPTQKVTNRLPTIVDPALTYHQELNVLARKCVLGDREIPLTGITSWVSVSPAGTIIDVGTGSAVRQPGCKDGRFVNPIPDIVIMRTDQMLRITGGDCVRWRLTGTETPSNRHFAPEVWSTEEFWLCDEVPNEAP